MIQVQPQTVKQIDDSSFIHYIVISSDCLLIIDRELQLVEWILEGNDTNGVYLQADDENEFLDAISLFKRMILNGENPVKYAHAL